jgi:hypothetical protein
MIVSCFSRKIGVCLGFSALVVAIGLSGCSGKDKTGTFAGKVTYKDEVVAMANMKLYASDGGGQPVATATTGNDGAYTFVNVPPGEYKVTVETNPMAFQRFGNSQSQPMSKEEIERQAQAAGRTLPKDFSGPQFPGDPSMMQGPKYVQLPAKYADVKKTDLTVTVKAGKNEPHDFTLTD